MHQVVARPDRLSIYEGNNVRQYTQPRIPPAAASS
jgi:hypothetical protein